MKINDIKILYKNLNDADLIEFAEERFKHLVGYFNSVYNMVLCSESAKTFLDMGRIDINEYQSRITNYDKERRIAHEMAITACAQINRLCDMAGIQHICPDTEDRHIIADFIGDFVYNIYIEEQKNSVSMDQAISDIRKKDMPNPKKIEEIKEVVNV